MSSSMPHWEYFSLNTFVLKLLVIEQYKLIENLNAKYILVALSMFDNLIKEIWESNFDQYWQKKCWELLKRKVIGRLNLPSGL